MIYEVKVKVSAVAHTLETIIKIIGFGQYWYIKRLSSLFLFFPNIVSFLPALGGLLSSLEKAKIHLDSDEEDFGFLADLLKSRELQALVNVHNKVRFCVGVCVCETAVGMVPKVWGCIVQYCNASACPVHSAVLQ